MREARDVFPEVGYEERKLGVLKVPILFNDFSLIFFGYIKSKMFLISIQIKRRGLNPLRIHFL